MVYSMGSANHEKPVLLAHGKIGDDFIEAMNNTELPLDKNLYLTANTFVSPFRRRNDTIFSFRNIVVDLDVHDDIISAEKKSEIIDNLAADIENNMFGVIPNTIVKTGRGLQLWFLLSEELPKWDKRYAALCYKLMKEISLVLDIHKKYEIIKVDKGATKKKAGFFRLPGSFNTKSGGWGSYKILHREGLPVNTVNSSHTKKRAGTTRVKKSPSFEKKEKAVDNYHENRPFLQSLAGGNAQSSALKREASLYKLISLRQQKGTATVGNEDRDLFLYSLFCIWSHTLPINEIMKRIFKMNSCFLSPMDENEINQRLQSASKKLYKISNSHLIELLNITLEEQDIIDLKPNKREEERLLKRQAKMERNDKIKRLYNEGMSIAAIAKKMEVCRNTVYKILKK